MDFIERFCASLKIPTWWPSGALAGDMAAEAVLLCFQDFLVENYSCFHKTVKRWVLSPYSVLYHWPGSDISKGAESDNAILFLGHYDVVAAETKKWNFDPFGAEIKDDYIYGRGSLDMKSILISLMEAAENLCAAEFTPRQDIWFAFGGDEERTGILGAMEAAKWFSQQGIRFSWILDEGTMVAENQIKGIDTPLALVSVEEKGFLSLDLCVTQEPGHASRPPKIQAAAILGKALVRLTKKSFPFKLIPTVETFFKQAAPLMKGIQGFAMAHCRALGPLFFAVAGANIPMLPFIMVATTDSRHYKELAGSIFRFSPHKLKPEDLAGVHGHDERISIENLDQGLKFYTSLLRSL